MSNLLEKASIVTTPTAYDNGKILSVKPVQSLGNELITNGDFATDSDWSKGTGWSISGGKGIVTNATAASIYQDVLTLSKSYKASFTISSIENGSLKIGIGLNFSQEFTEVGTYTYYGTPSNDSLLRITPSNGTNATIDNVSVKEVIDGDFDFTRNSSATRVNTQGLVEDVQILSSNLVQNGDFSQEGAELITNGDFSNGETNWDFGGDWTLVNGTAEILTGTNSFLIQLNVVDLSVKTYKIQYEVVSTNGSNFSFAGGNSAFGTVTLDSATIGVKTLYLKSNGTKRNLQFFQSSFIGSIDNVSVKEVGQDWTLGTGVTVGENKAIFTSTASGQSVSQNAVASSLTNGALAKVSFEVLSRTEGSFGVYFSGTLVGTLASAGVFTGYFTKGTETSFYIRALGTTSGSISNISVIEITDDTNLPRIDYTGGVGSWLFEPQSTNKVTYSEDFTQWTKAGGVSIESGYLAPNGSNNAYKVSGTSSSSLYLASITNSTDTRTIWAKTVSGTGDVYLCGNLNDANALFTVTSQWQRFELHGFTGGGATTFYAVDFRGSSTLTEVIIWGAQVEALSYATSYIPTNGSTVTRLQDAAFGAGSSDLINSTEGVLYAEIAALANDGTYRLMSLNDGTTTNRMYLGYMSTDNFIRIRLTSGAVTQVDFVENLSNATSFNKVAFKYKENDFALWINGIKVATDTSGVTPVTLTDLSFNAGSTNFFGKAKCVAVFKEALTDEELTCLTTI
jgi:hypothetical protein